MVSIDVRYLCGICQSEYRTEQEALDCEAQGRIDDIGLRVGDIVTVQKNFGWANGDPPWIINPEVHGGVPFHKPYKQPYKQCPLYQKWLAGIREQRRDPMFEPDDRLKFGNTNCFGPCCLMTFYWVVTETDLAESSGTTYDGLFKARARHRVRYWLVTKAVVSNVGAPYIGGYTFATGHYAPRLYTGAVPEIVQREAAELASTATTIGGLL